MCVELSLANPWKTRCGSENEAICNYHTLCMLVAGGVE